MSEYQQNPGNHREAHPSKSVKSKLNGITDALNKEFDFEEIYIENKSRVFSTAYRFVGNRADAEDITQDVFVKVFKNMKTFRGDAAISTWIYRITVNACFDFLRKRKRQYMSSLEDCSEKSLVSSPLSLGKVIEGMVTRLPEAYRKVFILYDIQGLKHREIADILDITQGASKSLLHRARAKLRQELSPYVRNRHLG